MFLISIIFQICISTLYVYKINNSTFPRYLNFYLKHIHILQLSCVFVLFCNGVSSLDIFLVGLFHDCSSPDPNIANVKNSIAKSAIVTKKIILHATILCCGNYSYINSYQMCELLTYVSFRHESHENRNNYTGYCSCGISDSN